MGIKKVPVQRRTREETINMILDRVRSLLEGPSCIQKAVLVMVAMQGRREDKGKNAYILHPLRVMFGMKTEDEKIPAIHHDDLEDTDLEPFDFENLGYTLSQIKIIESLTKNEAAYAVDYDKAHEEYLLNIEKSPVARRIKILDMQDNLRFDRLKNRKLTESDWKRMQRYITDLFRFGAYND